MDLNGLSAISYLQRTPPLNFLNILALAAETGILLFKEQVPLKFKKEISAVQCEMKTFRLISLSTPVSFCWTVPFRVSKFKKIYFSPQYLYKNLRSCMTVKVLMGYEATLGSAEVQSCWAGLIEYRPGSAGRNLAH
jgi:hypothetical protein